MTPRCSGVGVKPESTTPASPAESAVRKTEPTLWAERMSGATTTMGWGGM